MKPRERKAQNKVQPESSLDTAYQTYFDVKPCYVLLERFPIDFFPTRHEIKTETLGIGEHYQEVVSLSNELTAPKIEEFVLPISSGLSPEKVNTETELIEVKMECPIKNEPPSYCY